MRGLICVVLAIAVVFLTSNEAVEATVESTEISPNSPLYPSHALGIRLTKEAPKRFLRINHAAEGDSTLVSTADEERASKVLSQLSEKFKTTNVAKKFIATGKKTKGTFKKIPGVGNLTKMRKYKKYSGLLKRGWTPAQAKEAGKLKTTDEFTQYQAFYTAAQRQKAQVHPL